MNVTEKISTVSKKALKVKCTHRQCHCSARPESNWKRSAVRLRHIRSTYPTKLGADEFQVLPFFSEDKVFGTKIEIKTFVKRFFESESSGFFICSITDSVEL
uniref:Uncharacterized protein n=1 Tax=Ditylenchus dipsaci TaxID=166011 RepID=A0A915ENI5_9BILA